MQARMSTGGAFGNYQQRPMSGGTRIAAYNGGRQSDTPYTYVSEVYQPPRSTSMFGPSGNPQTGVMSGGFTTGLGMWNTGNRNEITYMDGAMYGAQEQFQPQGNRAENIPFSTDDMNGPMGGNSPGGVSKPSSKGSPFACLELSGGSSGEATLTQPFGQADSYLEQVTLKLFNPRVVPDRILHGIVYFKVTEPMRINYIKLKFDGKMNKKITPKKKKETPMDNDFPTTIFQKDVVASGSMPGTRSAGSYQAVTDDFDYADSLYLPDNMPDSDQRLKPFAGPITLQPGTHAIPFAVRINPQMNPTIEFDRINKNKGEGKFTLKCPVHAEIETQPTQGGGSTKITNDGKPVQVDLEVVGCGGLPPFADGRYFPAKIHTIANGMVLVEKTHLQPQDTIRVTVYSDKSKAIKSAYFEVFQLTYLPELGMSANANADAKKDEPGCVSIGKSKKVFVTKGYTKQYVSKVVEKFPPSLDTPGRVDQKHDDRQQIKEDERKAGCFMDLPLPTKPKTLDQSIDAAGIRIEYLLRIHLDVKGEKECTKIDQPITISSELLPNYKMRYIKFTE